FEAAAGAGRGLFVLARTSNPEAGPLQRAEAGGATVAQSVVDEVARRNATIDRGDDPTSPGPFGVVVGATVDDAPRLDELHGPVLMPEWVSRAPRSTMPGGSRAPPSGTPSSMSRAMYSGPVRTSRRCAMSYSTSRWRRGSRPAETAPTALPEPLRAPGVTRVTHLRRAQRRALAHFGRFAPRTTAVAVSLPIASHDNAQARGGDTPGTRPGTTSRCLVLLLRSSGPIPGPDPARGTGPPGYG